MKKKKGKKQQTHLLFHKHRISKKKKEKKEMMLELFVEKPCDHFICGLCAEVMKCPVQCPQGHTFCKSCFTTALESKGQCPIRCSEKRLEVSMLVVNRIVEDMIGELTVRCSSRVDSINITNTTIQPLKKIRFSLEEGCNWCGQYKNLSQHQKECLFINQRCPNFGCTIELNKKDLNSHLESCLYRQINCLLCNLSYKFIETEEHEESCLGKLIDCPNNCHLSFPKSELQNHLLVCPNEMILCKYHTVGCLHRSKRNEIGSHEQNLSLHFSLLTNLIVTQQNQITELTKQIKSRNTITTDMIFVIPDFQVNQVYTSHRQRIDGIEYYLIFHPNNDLINHSVYLVFPELQQTITCRTICSLCKSESRESSHTRRSIFAEYTPIFYYKSFADFIPSNRILSDGFIKSDGSLTIIETIVMLIA